MAQRRFFRFVTQDRDRLPRHRSRANETRESESGFFLAFAQKKTVSIKRSSSPKTATFEAESRRFIGRSVRSSGSRAELLQLAQVLESARSLICTGCFRDFCVADQSPSLDKFYRSGAGTPEARAGSRGRGISTHARYVRPDIPVDRSVSPLVEHGAGALGLPAQDPAGSRPAGRSSPLIASPREERRVTRTALAARAARRLPGPARSGGSRPDPDRSTSD